MKRRVIALTSAVVMLLALAVGCAGNGTSDPTGADTPNHKEAQLTVAVNPILYYDDGTSVIAYNDVKNATRADFDAASLTALHQKTAWMWAYRTANGWKERAAYQLDKWQNGAGVKAKKAYAYSYNASGTTSLASYYAQSTELTTYSEAQKVPDYGLMLSVTGKEEEALCYTVQKDGVMNVAEGSFTAVQAVAGIQTGFLAEDGTPRSASVRILINDKQLWSGTLCNSTAAPDGKAVTALSFPTIKDLPVTAGDMVFLCVKLEATANKDEDVSVEQLTEDDYYKTVLTTQKVPKDETSNGVINSDESIPMIYDWEPNFVILRSSKAGDTVNELSKAMLSQLISVTEADWRLRNEDHLEMAHEIVIGEMKERPESVKLMKELTSYRANHAADYIIRRVGTKVYIVAGSDLAMTAAVELFMERYCQSDKAVIAAGLNVVYRPEFAHLSIAGNAIGNYVIRTEKYPSLLVVKAAENIRQQVLDTTGFVLEIKNMTDDGKHSKYEIQLGPMQGSLHYTTDNERFTSADGDAHFSIDPEGLIVGKGEGYYEAAVKGNHLVINGGSSYAISAATEKALATLLKDKTLSNNYGITGNYASAATVTNDTRKTYSDCDYSLSDGYALVWAEEFNSYTGTDAEQERAIKKRWSLPSDTTHGPTVMGEDADGNAIWDEQRRPNVYGENYWVWNDTQNQNGYLLQVTKKESYGYDAGRVISEKKWAFRYGIWETRIVVGTRNGACSALWTMGETPGSGPKNEIDLYENFGEDLFRACLHSHHSTLSQADSEGHIGHHDNGDISWDPHYPAEGEHFYDTFHYLSIEWDCDRITMFCDGVPFATADLTPAWMIHFRADTTIKLAMGVGTEWYCGWIGEEKDPDNWLEDVSKFFEVQITDNTRVYQTTNVGKKGYALNNFVFSEGYIADNT